jgi:hypothetical protein
MAGKKAPLPMKNSKHGAYSKHVRRRYSDKRTTEGKQLAAIIKALVDDCGPDLTAVQCLILDRIREKLIVLMQIGQYVDKQPSVLNEKGELLSALGKNYLAFSNALRLDLQVLYDGKQKNKTPSYQEIVHSLEEVD